MCARVQCKKIWGKWIRLHITRFDTPRATVSLDIKNRNRNRQEYIFPPLTLCLCDLIFHFVETVVLSRTARNSTSHTVGTTHTVLNLRIVCMHAHTHAHNVNIREKTHSTSHNAKTLDIPHRSLRVKKNVNATDTRTCFGRREEKNDISARLPFFH